MSNISNYFYNLMQSLINCFKKYKKKDDKAEIYI